MLGLLLASAQEVESLIVPSLVLLGEREGSGGVEGQPGLGQCCFKKGDWKTTPGDIKGFCAGRSPWGGF